MLFIYGMRLIADLSLYFFFANLISKSLVLTIIPAVIYAIYMIVTKKLETSWDRQSDVFGISWKLFLTVSIFACLVGKQEVLLTRCIPMAVVSLAASVLLMRMLRHGPDIYLSKQYQFKNLLLLCATIGVTFLLSSKFVLQGVLGTINLVYMGLILPVLTLLITCLTAIIGFFLRLLSWMHLTEIDFGESKLSGSETINPFKDATPEMLQQSQSAQMFFTIVGIIAVLIAAFFILRWLSSSEKNLHPSLGGILTSKDDLPEVKRERSSSLSHQVRRQYRKFLKLYKSQGERITLSDTTSHIAERSEKHFSPETVAEIREIYIRARYNNHATKEDLRKLRQMNQILRQKL